MPSKTSAIICSGSMVPISLAFPANPIIKEKAFESQYRRRGKLQVNLHRGAEFQLVKSDDSGSTGMPPIAIPLVKS